MSEDILREVLQLGHNLAVTRLLPRQESRGHSVGVSIVKCWTSRYRRMCIFYSVCIWKPSLRTFILNGIALSVVGVSVDAGMSCLSVVTLVAVNSLAEYSWIESWCAAMAMGTCCLCRCGRRSLVDVGKHVCDPDHSTLIDARLDIRQVTRTVLCCKCKLLQCRWHTFQRTRSRNPCDHRYNHGWPCRNLRTAAVSKKQDCSYTRCTCPRMHPRLRWTTNKIRTNVVSSLPSTPPGWSRPWHPPEVGWCVREFPCTSSFCF